MTIGPTQIRQFCLYVQQATRLIASARSILVAVVPEAGHTCRHLYALNLWLQGKCLLLRVTQYHNKSSGQHYAHLQHLFRRLHLTPSKYTFTFFNSTGVCYVRVTTSQMHKAFSYVGCSTGTLTTRESNRNRKFQQLQNQAIAHAELALRWWKKHNNYHQYVPLTIQHSIPTPDLQTVEAAYIQQLQPRLNYTYIHHHLKKANSAISTSKNKPSPKQALHPFGARFDANTFRSGFAALRRHHAFEIAHSLADAGQPFLQHSPQVRHHKATHEALHSITCHICPLQDDTQHGTHTSANSPEIPCHRADQTQATHSQRCRTVAYLPTRPCQLPNRCAPIFARTRQPAP